MKRFTYDWADSGRPDLGSNLNVFEGVTCITYCDEHCSEHGTCDDCEVYLAINRLAAYERTGLLPEEIELKRQRKIRIKSRFRERYKIQTQRSGEARQILDKIRADAAINELTELYSLIFGVSSDEAAAKLQKSLEEEADKCKQQTQ